MPKKQRQPNKKKQQKKSTKATSEAAGKTEKADRVDQSGPESRVESSAAAIESSTSFAGSLQRGQVTGLVNLGHTCYFNAAIQVRRSLLQRRRRCAWHSADSQLFAGFITKRPAGAAFFQACPGLLPSTIKEGSTRKRPARSCKGFCRYSWR